MAIVVNLDVMMARRKMSLNELSGKVDLTQANALTIKIQTEYKSIEDAIKKLEKASYGKYDKMKNLIQTRETGISRLFGFETDVTILKSLELQAKELTNKNNEHLTRVLQNGGLSNKLNDSY